MSRFVPYYRRDIVFFDVETSGLDPDKHEILEIAAVRMRPCLPLEGHGMRRAPEPLASAPPAGSLATLFEIARMETRVIPIHIADADPRALEINGYNPAVWDRSAVSLEQALGRFAEVCGPDKVMLAGHNAAKFDWPFMLKAFARTGTALPLGLDYHMIDTASMAWPWFAAGLIPRTSLETLCDYFGVSNDGAHRAGPDVDRTIQVYLQILHRLRFMVTAGARS
jgi:DNA polymerase-3 subunit epsilon